MRNRAPLFAVLATVALAAVVALVWGAQVLRAVPPVTRDDLESEVAALYVPDDPADEVEVTCDGELASEVDASQDCQVAVGDGSADVHVVVTEVEGQDVHFDATPYLPADRLGDAIRTSLEEQGSQVDDVTCDGELLGVVGRTATCTLTPSAGSGEVRVVVTSVDGLLVDFDYRVVS